MAKFIFNIVTRINTLNRKGLCPYFSPETICEEVHNASLDLWKKHVQEFERTQLLSVYMDPFRRKEQVTLTAGIGTLVDSKGKFKTSVMVASSDIIVVQSDLSHWGNLINDSVRGPAVNYPVCRIDNADIVVLPMIYTSVYVHYLKNPIKPVFAYTVVDEDYIYSDIDSTDIEWSEVCHSDIVDRTLGSLGVSMREAGMVQYSNTEFTKEGK